MTQPATRARIISAVTNGEWANLQDQPEDERIVDANFLRRLLLGLEAESNDVGDPIEVTITAAGVRIKGATIKGKLDLADCSGIGGEGLPALMLEGCRFEGDGHPDSDEPDVMTCLDLSHARLARLSLNGSRFSHLRAPHCRIDGPLDISNVQPLDGWVAPAWPGVDPAAWRAYMQAWRDWHARRVKASVANERFEEAEPEKPKEPEAEHRPPWPTAVGAHCWINLRGAQIDGDLAGANAKLLVAPPARTSSLYRYALTLANAVIHGSVRLSPGVMAFGGVSFHTAAIDRDLDMRGAILTESGSGTALQASQVSVGGTARLNERFSAKGTIWLFGAKIDRNLNMGGAFLDGSGSNALTADNLFVGGSALLRKNFIAKGTIKLLGARIDGNFEMGRAVLDGSSDNALTADNLSVGGSALLRKNFIAKGTIWLLGAKIGGNLDMGGAVLDGSRGNALTAGNLSVSGSALLRKNFIAKGTIKLLGARIDGNLNMGGSILDGNGKAALTAINASIGGDLLLGDRFIAKGELSMLGIIIKQSFQIINAKISNNDAEQNSSAINLQSARIEGRFVLKENLFSGQIVFSNLDVGCLADTESGYEGAERLVLDGFVYHRLEQPILHEKHKTAARSRKAWLARDTEYHAQPYIQLARRLTAQGYSEDAGQVRVFKEQQEQRRRWQALANLSLSWPIRGLVYCVIWLFGLFFGYGYRPTAAFGTLMGGILSGWLFFGLLNGAGLMVVDQQAVAAMVQGTDVGASLAAGPVAKDIPCGDQIRSFLYALDVFIPLVDLRQESKCEIGLAVGYAEPWFPGSADVARYLKALYAIAGWLITSLSILTFSGLLQRRDQDV